MQTKESRQQEKVMTIRAEMASRPVTPALLTVKRDVFAASGYLTQVRLRVIVKTASRAEQGGTVPPPLP